MNKTMRMPEVLTGMAEAIVSEWFISVGDKVEDGMPVAEVETEKATVEVTTDASGVVTELLVAVGQSIRVGTPLFSLSGVESDNDQEPTATRVNTEIIQSTTELKTRSAATNTETGTIQRSPGGAARQFISPIVRLMAREHGVDPAQIVGTGPHGRIVRRDFEKYLSQQTVRGHSATSHNQPREDNKHVEVIPLSNMRQAIARRLTESKSTVPHFYLTSHCDVSKLLALRSEINSGERNKVTINDFIMMAVAQAHVAVPQANVTWGGDHLKSYNSVDVAVAVATEGGLVTPVIRGANYMGLKEISKEIADLASRARVGKLRQPEIEGGSFTVSNLGMYGINEFTAILNPPQSGILAVGAINDRALVVDGQVDVRPMMTVTASWDHRAVDGAVGAEWLKMFTEGISNPLSLLV